MQISRLSALSLKNLATCVAKRELPADFPPKDTATTLFNYADGSKTVSNPVIVTVTPTAVTYARSHRVGDEQPLVTVSNRAKRPLAELQIGGDSPAFVCEFTPTRKVREMAAAVCDFSASCCFVVIAVALVEDNHFFLVTFLFFPTLFCAARRVALLHLQGRVQIVSLADIRKHFFAPVSENHLFHYILHN